MTGEQKSNQNWIDKLKAQAEEAGNIICMGLDPEPALMPGDVAPAYFFQEILRVMRGEEGIQVPTFKPNMAFYAALGNGDVKRGMGVLVHIRNAYQAAGMHFILDAKRSTEVKKTAAKYAHAAFDPGAMNADALTVDPYMGGENGLPEYTKYCNPEHGGKGIYLLCRTSNPGAGDIQDIITDDGRPVYMRVAEMIAGKWHVPGVGAVVGATSLDELEQIAEYFVSTGKEIPLLVPGFGNQLGSPEEAMQRLRQVGYDIRIVRGNSSSAISEAWNRENPKCPEDYAAASVRALKRLEEHLRI
jgi:orotidine-5'-phosphate decarboxylase